MTDHQKVELIRAIVNDYFENYIPKEDDFSYKNGMYVLMSIVFEILNYDKKENP